MSSRADEAAACPDPEPLAFEMKVVRAELGLTRMAFADLLGFHWQSITKWETGGARPKDPSVILKLMSVAPHRADRILGAAREVWLDAPFLERLQQLREAREEIGDVAGEAVPA